MKRYGLTMLLFLFSVVAFGQKPDTSKPALPLYCRGRGRKISDRCDGGSCKAPASRCKSQRSQRQSVGLFRHRSPRDLIAGWAKLGELRGKQLAAYVVIDAADGYKVVFGIAELDTSFTDKSVILADKKDSKLLPETSGPWQIIVPDEKRPGRWVRQVTAIHVRFAK